MSINKFNSEGYYDPTAYEAMTTVEKEEKALRAFRPIVYICSPYAGDVSKNVENARNYSRFAVDKGYIPVAPHLLFPQFLNDNNTKERQLGLFFGNAIMYFFSRARWKHRTLPLQSSFSRTVLSTPLQNRPM